MKKALRNILAAVVTVSIATAGINAAKQNDIHQKFITPKMDLNDKVKKFAKNNSVKVKAVLATIVAIPVVVGVVAYTIQQNPELRDAIASNVKDVFNTGKEKTVEAISNVATKVQNSETYKKAADLSSKAYEKVADLSVDDVKNYASEKFECFSNKALTWFEKVKPAKNWFNWSR